ncbi:hypothetical protein GC177_10025 [bacterium]|nr:hypothetical protein [bacterium]
MINLTPYRITWRFKEMEAERFSGLFDRINELAAQFMEGMPGLAEALQEDQHWVQLLDDQVIDICLPRSMIHAIYRGLAEELHGFKLPPCSPKLALHGTQDLLTQDHHQLYLFADEAGIADILVTTVGHWFYDSPRLADVWKQAEAKGIEDMLAEDIEVRPVQEGVLVIGPDYMVDILEEGLMAGEIPHAAHYWREHGMTVRFALGETIPTPAPDAVPHEVPLSSGFITLAVAKAPSESRPAVRHALELVAGKHAYAGCPSADRVDGTLSMLQHHPRLCWAIGQLSADEQGAAGAFFQVAQPGA